MRFSKRYLFVCTFVSIVFADAASSQELKIGQRCPDIILKNIINYSIAESRLSDFKGKLVILDFWGTGCTACIQAFAKIDSLQKKFDGRVQFIAVNRESYDSTIRFFKRKNHIRKPSIPFVTGDAALSALFPHLYVPHHVWIDSNSVVQYITDGHNATAEHIQQFLSGNHPVLNEKKYEAKDDYYSPMMAIADKKGLDHLESYSLLMHCISGMSFGNSVGIAAERNNGYRLTQNCASILQLYTTAFSEGGKYDFSNSNTVMLEVNDKSKYVIPTDNNLKDEWDSNYSYNYELMVPAAESKEIYKKMQQDLFRYFNVTGIIEKRMVKCLALVRITAKDKLKSKGGKPASNFWVMTDEPVRYITNQNFDRFTGALLIRYQYIGFARPLINNTNYKGRIDIQLSVDAIDTFDINKINEELFKYGLTLKEQNTLREVLILREAK